MTATPITPLILSGTTWDTFDTQATRVNELIVRINDIGTYDDANIAGGTINGTIIGNLVPSDATFENVVINTSINVSTANIIFAPNQISGDVIYGGTAQVNEIEVSSAPTSNNHATRKDYVDSAISEIRNELIAYSMIFGV